MDSFPDFSSMSEEELLTNIKKYYKAWNAQKKKNELYENIITQLTDRSSTVFVKLDNDGKTFIPNEEEITSFKIGGDSRSILLKLKNVVSISQAKIDELERTNSFLQQKLQSEEECRVVEVRQLQQQLSRLKENDPIERRKDAFTELFAKRKSIPIKDIKVAADTQSYILSQLFSSEYLSSDRDGKEELFREQKEVELNIIESCISLLKNQFDNLPDGVVRLDNSSISYDVFPILEHLLEARNRLSYMMGEKAFTNLLFDHIRELTEILDLFNSRCKYSDTYLTIILSPYEKGLLFYTESEKENYLHTYEKAIDIQKRLMISSRMSNKLTPFKLLEDFPTSYMFCQLEDVARVVMITSKPINNIVFVEIKESNGPDHFSYYCLENIVDNNRSWKLDSHLLYVVRLFMERYCRVGGLIFRQFYRDVFGHNDYIKDFEKRIEEKGLERWKQMKILYENIQIASDEYLIGEILRRVIRTHAPMFPIEGIDTLQTCKDAGDATLDFQLMRKRWKQGLPAAEEEPEEYMYCCFDKYKTWDQNTTRSRYYQRWKTYLTQEKYTI